MPFDLPDGDPRIDVVMTSLRVALHTHRDLGDVCAYPERLCSAQMRALVIADNKLAENPSWDDEMLALELAAIRDEEIDLDVLGFDEDELAKLPAASDADPLADEDAIPEIAETPVTTAGDLWILGNHRLLAGDAT